MKIEVCTIAEFNKRKYESHFDVLEKCTEFPKDDCKIVVQGGVDGVFSKSFDFDTIEWKELKKFIDNLRSVVALSSKVFIEYQ